jgi:hypothetical protein
MLDHLGQEIKVGSTCAFISVASVHKMDIYIIVDVNEESQSFAVKKHIDDNLILTKSMLAQNFIIIDDIIEAKPELFI